jgi:hypothetical protein
LFARKFMPHALDRLLRFAPRIMQFNWLIFFVCLICSYILYFLFGLSSF